MEWKLQAVHGRAWLVHLKRFHWVYFSLFCFFVFFHIMITHNRLFPQLHFFFTLSFFLCIQSLHPFQLHSSFFHVFNLSSSPSLFSPAAPCNANTTCSEGKWIIEAAAAIPSVQKWAAEEGWGGTEGGIRGDERNGDGRFVRRHNGFGVQRNLILFTSLLHGTVHVVGEVREVNYVNCVYIEQF